MTAPTQLPEHAKIGAAVMAYLLEKGLLLGDAAKHAVAIADLIQATLHGQALDDDSSGGRLQ